MAMGLGGGGGGGVGIALCTLHLRTHTTRMVLDNINRKVDDRSEREGGCSQSVLNRHTSHTSQTVSSRVLMYSIYLISSCPHGIDRSAHANLR